MSAIPIHETNVYPLPEVAVPAPPVENGGESKRSAAARWTKRLGTQFCPVSSYFLRNYNRLRPHDGADGLSSTEAMVVIQIMDHKWDERAPFPSLARIAERMGLSVRRVRQAVKNLEDLGLVRREPSPNPGGSNRYHFDGLFAALERLMDQDVEARAAAEEKA